MSTTNLLTRGQLYYTCANSRNIADKKRLNAKLKSNPRYAHFNHVHFTAGDTEQFEWYRDLPSSTAHGVPSTLSESLRSSTAHGVPSTLSESRRSSTGEQWSAPLCSVYKPYSRRDVSNTFKYLFHKFKKGIYVKIRNGALETFLPFSNTTYVNEFAHLLKVSGSLQGFFRRCNGRHFKVGGYLMDPSRWYANNCLLRFENPLQENDTNVCVLRDMLNELVRTHCIPDIDFFVNKRDFPVLNKGKWEPYNHIWGSEKHPLVSHVYDNYIPIFSCSVPEHFSDVLWPCWDDWIRVRSAEDIFFSRSNNDYSHTTAHGVPRPTADHRLHEWKNKKAMAVWRGSSTGSGTTPQTNTRVKLVHLATEEQLCGNLCIDAEITKWNNRPRKLETERCIQVPQWDAIRGKRLTWNQMKRYKYRIHIAGHGAAYRLGAELGSGCTLLIVDSPYKLWFQHHLKPGVHYVAVQADLSDLVEKIKWLQQNDTEAFCIARNALNFYNEFLNKKGILNFMANTLKKLSSRIGVCER